MREPANRKDFADDRVGTGDGEQPLLWLQPRGRHQRPQTGARNVFDRRKIDDDVVGGGINGREQPRLKLGAGEIVDASDRPQNEDVGLASLADLHPTLPTYYRADGILKSLAGRGKNRRSYLRLSHRAAGPAQRLACSLTSNRRESESSAADQLFRSEGRGQPTAGSWRSSGAPHAAAVRLGDSADSRSGATRRCWPEAVASLAQRCWSSKASPAGKAAGPNPVAAVLGGADPSFAASQR